MSYTGNPEKMDLQENVVVGVGSVQREQIYILINKSTMNGFRGSSLEERGWIVREGKKI